MPAFIRLTPALLLALLLPTALHADDGAASIAAGGLVLMHRETRITMAKELLHISRDKVIVDYDFRNDSAETITTGIAFPVPVYSWGEKQNVAGDAAFDDFKLTVDGVPVRFLTEVRAFLGKRDVTAQLLAEHIDPASFGHAVAYGPSDDYFAANPAKRKRLLAAGLYRSIATDSTADTASDPEAAWPDWSVQKKYYWTQTFPPHATVHIRHSYSPVVGGTNSVRYGIEAAQHPGKKSADDKYIIDEVNSLCLEPPLRQRLLTLAQRDDHIVPFSYVDFILTTANTWKTPIEDFTLLVDRATPDKDMRSQSTGLNPNHSLVSFCWDGPVTKPDADHFSAHITNLVPTKELRIGFVSVDQTDPDPLLAPNPKAK
jgi:hypothetical protein